MNEGETGLMEEQILKEETIPSEQKENQSTSPNPEQNQKSPKDLLLKLKDFKFRLTKGKIIVLTTLFLTLVVTYFALILLAQKQNGVVVDTKPIYEKKQAPEATLSAEASALKKDVDFFQESLKKSDNYFMKFQAPTIDLDINFK